jgi:hypothetical protein
MICECVFSSWRIFALMPASRRDWAASGANRTNSRAAAETGLTMRQMLTFGRALRI